MYNLQRSSSQQDNSPSNEQGETNDRIHNANQAIRTPTTDSNKTLNTKSNVKIVNLSEAQLSEGET